MTSQCVAPPSKTLSASFGPKWPYKRTMSAPASIVPRQDSKMGIPLTFPFPKIFFSNQVLVPSTEKEKIYSRQISAPILKRKTSRFGLGQFLSGSSNNNASTSTSTTASQVQVPATVHTITAVASNPLTTTGSNANTLSHSHHHHHHNHHPFSLHSHQVHPASSGFQSQSLLQGNCCGTPHNSRTSAAVATAPGSALTTTPSVKGSHPHPHHFHSTNPQKQQVQLQPHHYHHHGTAEERRSDAYIAGHAGGNGGQGRPRACVAVD